MSEQAFETFGCFVSFILVVIFLVVVPLYNRFFGYGKEDTQNTPVAPQKARRASQMSAGYSLLLKRRSSSQN